MLTLLFCYLLFVNRIFSDNLKSLTGQSLYKCTVNTPEQLTEIENKLDILKFHDYKGYAIVRVQDENQRQIISTYSNCQLTVSDLGKSRANTRRLMVTNNTAIDPFFHEYRSYDEIREALQAWALKYNMTFIPSIGKTYEKRDIYAFVISKNTTDKVKKSIWFNGGIHAREWISPASVMYTIHQLLLNLNSKKVAPILEKFDLHFTPLSNPDGYEFSRTGDRLWRKNRRLNKDGTYGVDLNRNFDDHWGMSGASLNTTAENYRGESAHSEPETQALIKYGLSLPNRYAGIDWHSYGQLILRNWGFKYIPSNNEVSTKKLGDNMARIFMKHGYNYTSDLAAGLYPASGGMDDWMAARAGMISYTVELCPDDDEVNFLVPVQQMWGCARAAHHASMYFFYYFTRHYDLPPPLAIP